MYRKVNIFSENPKFRNADFTRFLGGFEVGFLYLLYGFHMGDKTDKASISGFLLYLYRKLYRKYRENIFVQQETKKKAGIYPASLANLIFD